MQRNLSISGQHCSGCSYCQLACSLLKTGVFNPQKARILIQPGDSPGGFKVAFKEVCDRCGYCARFCFYDVLRTAEDGSR